MSYYAGAELIYLTGAVVMGIFGWMLYNVFRPTKYEADLTQRQCILYGAVMDRVAKKKGISIEKELLKSKILSTQGRSFSDELKKEIVKEFFGEKKEKE